MSPVPSTIRYEAPSRPEARSCGCVLIVDDSRTQALKLRLLVESKGYEVHTAAEGSQALELLASHAVDLVLSDVNMPGMTGYELCSRIKAERDVPVILLTALNETEDIHRGLECGADNFLCKPYDSSRLFERMETLLAPELSATPRRADLRLVETTDTGGRRQVVDFLFSAFEEVVASKSREHESRLQEKTLRQSLGLLQSTLDALPAAIAILDEGGEIIAVNQGWRKANAGSPFFGAELGVGIDYPQNCAGAGGKNRHKGRQLANALRRLPAEDVARLTTEYPCSQSDGSKRWFQVHAACFNGTGSLRVVVAHEEITELKQVEERLRRANETLEELVHRDPLTDLLNRRGLQMVLTHVLNGMRRNRTEAMVAIIDVDDFKPINDSLGHAVGDVVLKEIGRKLTEALRGTDFVARIGGDEFMVLLTETPYVTGRAVAERMRRAISNEPIMVKNGKPVQTTVSIGLSPVTPQASSIDELLSMTHEALHQSKRGSKNRVSTSGFRNADEPASDGTPAQDRGPVSVILSAVHRGDLCRPVRHELVRLKDEETVGYEFLTRATIETVEMPDDLFRFSLENNALTLVDHHCFKTCISQSADLPPRIVRNVNLFPSTLIDIPVEHLLEDFPADRRPGAFCIEICEQQIIGDPSYLAPAVAELKEAGIRIAIDDVGYGQSCLESLLFLDPDVVKIDRKLVTGAHADAAQRRNLERLVKVLRVLDADIVAEGIETRADLDLARLLGVEYGQGYYWGKPA